MVYFNFDIPQKSKLKMAKGKHAPAKGAIREDKVLHPKSRKAVRMHAKEQRKLKLSGKNHKNNVGGVRLQILGEKLLWFHENLSLVLEENEELSTQDLFDLIENYIARHSEELEQIKLKNSIGSGQYNKRNQHSSRQTAIENARKTELEEFQGCGLEVPDLQDPENLRKFQEWNGELRFVQNFKLKRITKNSLQEPIEDVHQMITE